MKPDSEKLKSRTALSMNDPDWSNAQKAAKIEKIPVSQFMRDAVNDAAYSTITKHATAKKGRVG